MTQLWVSPVSKEVLEAAFIARSRGCEVNLMCSVGQVGPKAYTGLTHEVFDAELCRLSALYSTKHMFIERDHLGRNGEKLDEWLEMDKDLFDGVMLHLFDAESARPYVDKWSNTFDWQLGPGEDDSKLVHESMWELARERGAAWVSFPTGCLIDGLRNKGQFNVGRVARVREQVGEKVKVRGHNCDYLTHAQLKLVGQHVDGVNVAPQLGVVQTCLYLTHARMWGAPIKYWEEACRQDLKNRARWCEENDQAIQGVGHYHYDRVEWRDDVRHETVQRLAWFIEDLYREINSWRPSGSAS